MSSENLVTFICHWTVESGNDNVSDHQTISYRLRDNIDRQQTLPQGRKWNTSQRVDLDAFATGVLLARWNNPNIDMPTNTNTITEDFKSIVTKAADFACPPKVATCRKAVHWWTKDITALRRVCNASRRFVERGATGDDLALLEPIVHLKNVRRDLRLAIRRSKKRCRSNLISSIGQYNGFSKWLENESPKQLHVWCYAHCLNLVLMDTTSNSTSAVSLFGLLNSCAVFFRDSHKRMDIWREISSDCRVLNLIGQTRWWAKDAALQKVFI